MANPPKYVQIAEDLRTRFSVYASDQKLPSEFHLQQEYNVSRQTIRTCLELLREEGLIRSERGSGWFYSGSSTQSKKNMRICVITTYITDYIFPHLLRGIEETAAEQGYSITLNVTNNSIATEHRILKSLMDSQVDGIIVEGTKTALPSPNAASYYKLAEMNIPVVFMNAYYNNLHHKNIVHVVTDDYGGGKDSVQYLIEQGHSKIGGIFKSDDMQGVQRYSGYINTLAENNLDMDDSRVMWFTTESKSSAISAASERLTWLLNSCTGLVCYNDEIALKVMEIMSRKAHTITSIASFDNNYATMPSDTDFSTLPHPKARLGATAVRLLLNMINGQTEHSVVMPWK